MRFLVDACTGNIVANWLRSLGHDVFSVVAEAHDMTDEQILDKANKETWQIVTVDKGFGEMVFKEVRMHHGIILLRIKDQHAASYIAALERVFQTPLHDLIDRFVVVTDHQVRFVPPL